LVKWEEVLKVQVLGSKQKVKMGIKPLPKEEKTDCRERLQELMENVQLKQLKRDGITGHAQGMVEVSDIFSSGIPTEAECCEILKFIEDFFNHSDGGRYSGKLTSGGNKMEMNMWKQKSLLTIEFTFRLKAHVGFPLVVIRTTDIGEISMTATNSALLERKEVMNWTKF
tara:strand:- start:598 stop:1104 length:507 start_codon:yes stop_codon:yes gene_type:complete